MAGAEISIYQWEACTESVYNRIWLVIELDKNERNSSVIMGSFIVDNQLKGDYRDLELIKRRMWCEPTSPDYTDKSTSVYVSLSGSVDALAAATQSEQSSCLALCEGAGFSSILVHSAPSSASAHCSSSSGSSLE
jgi:hypothetical protein